MLLNTNKDTIDNFDLKKKKNKFVTEILLNYYEYSHSNELNLPNTRVPDVFLGSIQPTFEKNRLPADFNNLRNINFQIT